MDTLNSIGQLGESLKSRYKEILFMTFVSFLLYSVMISNELTNTYDGMWRGDYGYIGPWELSIGRWFWQYLNYFRLDLAPEPTISIISLLSLNAADFLFVERLDLKRKWSRFFIWLALIGNTAVSIYCSYRYMLPTFTFSYLLSMLGAFFLTDFLIIGTTSGNKNIAMDLAFGIFCVTLSLGLYQANLGCTLVFIGLFLLSLPDTYFSCRRIFWLKALAMIFTLGISCIIYKILWSAHLFLQN